MHTNSAIEDVLKRYKEGKLSSDAAAEEIQGLRMDHVGDIACLDTGRAIRCGMPEVVLAEGKDPEHLGEIAVKYTETAGRCIITRISADQGIQLQNLAREHAFGVDYRKAGNIMVLMKDKNKAPAKTGGKIAIVTAGTSDIRVAEEAKVIAEEMGCDVRSVYDVGAAGIHRLFPALKHLLDAHVFIVCAGREGTLPAVVAGLVDKPVIGVPVSTGYGYMGQGRAALASMLQSCSVVGVVNIDAGFTAGALASRIANLGVRS